MWKNKVASLVNILGLSLGLLAFVLILEYVAFEWSYNGMYSQSDRVFRLVSQTEEADVLFPPGYAAIFKEQFPEIEEVVRILDGTGNGVFRLEDAQNPKSFREINTAFADAAFLQFFDRPITAGDPDLSQPQTMAISSSTAKKYFGEDSPIGRQLKVSNNFGDLLYQVVAVYEDMPINSDIRFDILLSLQTLYIEANRNGNGWADPNGIQNRFSKMYLTLGDADQQNALENKMTKWAAEILPEAPPSLHLQALADLHLGDGTREELPTSGSRSFVHFLLVVAILILAIAWINYINLSTAQSIDKAREIGVRKVVGASRMQLVRQHLLETFVLTLLSVAIVASILPLVQGYFNDLVALPLSFGVFQGSSYLWMALAIVPLGALLAGSYVAFVLTGFSPMQMLRGRYRSSKGGLWMRKGLVVSQFVVSIAFIASTFILFDQLHFLNTVDLGMKIDQLVAITGPYVKDKKFGEQRQAFRDGLAQLPFVSTFCSSGNLPGRGHNFSASKITRLNPREGEEDVNYRILFVDENYLSTYQMNLIAGRSFTTAEAIKGWDAPKMILNEKAVESMGFSSPEEAIGQMIKWEYGTSELVGVIGNYNHKSLHIPIAPTVLVPGRNSGFFTLQMDANDLTEKIAHLEGLYQKHFPGNPFQYQFLDDVFARHYESEQRLSSLFTNASAVAIFISILGLFGLVTFVSRQKTKEIGIRKVLGASIANIVGLLSMDFLKLVLIAIVIAIPFSWYIMNRWLENFAYRIDIEWWVFALAGGLASGIAFATLSVQSIKAALANPVDSLRNE
ncbi:MAG: ABC transporter permease [Bacteroidota bacterium]